MSAKDSKHWNWKGDSVEYSALHSWIRRRLGSANSCELKDETCSTTFDWANKSGKYTRERDDWISLCRSHHHRFDCKPKKLSFENVREIRRRYEQGNDSQGKLAREYSVSKMTIYSIIHRRKWSYIK